MKKILLTIVVAVILMACNSNSVSFSELQRDGEYCVNKGKPFTGISTEKWENDTIKSLKEWKDGKMNGVCKNYNRSGKIIDSTIYINNNISGTYTRFYDNGKVQLISSYLNGVLDGESLAFNNKGQLVSKCKYSLGSIVGSLTTYTIKEIEIPETVTKKFNEKILKLFPNLLYEWEDDYKCNYGCKGESKNISIAFNANNDNCNKIYRYTYRVSISLDLMNEKIPRQIVKDDVFKKMLTDFKKRCSQKPIWFTIDMGNFSKTQENFIYIDNNLDDTFHHYEITNTNSDTYYYNDKGDFIDFEEIAY